MKQAIIEHLIRSSRSISSAINTAETKGPRQSVNMLVVLKQKVLETMEAVDALPQEIDGQKSFAFPVPPQAEEGKEPIAKPERIAQELDIEYGVPTE